jgi:hypothetical protein
MGLIWMKFYPPHQAVLKFKRAFWKLSFIKFSDEENQAFKNILLRRNIKCC